MVEGNIKRERPRILIEFNEDDTVTWKSCGWGHLPLLMSAAKLAITFGDTPEQVVDLLQAAGFEVVVLTTEHTKQ